LTGLPIEQHAYQLDNSTAITSTFSHYRVNSVSNLQSAAPSATQCLQLNPVWSGGAAWPTLTPNPYACSGVVVPYQYDYEPYQWDLDGTRLPMTVVSTAVDGFGNPTTVTATTVDPTYTATGYSRTTTNTYKNDPTNWWIGRLTKSAVQSVRPASN
jgi:hypothetical protein